MKPEYNFTDIDDNFIKIMLHPTKQVSYILREKEIPKTQEKNKTDLMNDIKKR